MVAQEAFETFNQKLSESGFPYKLAMVDNADLKYLDKNARYMKAEQFHNLKDNVKKDGGLSSLPFCVYENGKYLILSGNHRAKANEEAGFDKTLILYTDKKLSKEEKIAIQLSHNSLAGKDDPVILKELWQEIENIDEKYYAGFDDKLLEELEKVSIGSLTEANLEYRTYTFLFLEPEAEMTDEALEELERVNLSEEIRLVEFKDYDRLLDAIKKINNSYNVKNSATAFGLLLSMFENNYEALKDGWMNRELKGEDWLPIASVLGNENLPAQTVVKMNRAMELMLGDGDVKKESKWGMMDVLLDQYLSEREGTK